MSTTEQLVAVGDLPQELGGTLETAITGSISSRPRCGRIGEGIRQSPPSTLAGPSPPQRPNGPET
jgi:hypothetical protein